MKRIFCLVIALLVLGCQGEKEYDSSKLANGIYAIIDTDKGAIVMNLFYDKTPVTVASFVTLAEGKNNFVNSSYKDKHFFDGLTFHRVENEPPVIQGGCPEGTGLGGPGYVFKNEIVPGLQHAKEGMLAMANSGADTNGSQFYITTAAAPYLDGNYTVFGSVVSGIEVVKKIARDDKINSVQIIRKGAEAKKFDGIKVFNQYFEKQMAAQKEAEAQSKVIKKEKATLIAQVKKEGTKTNSGLIYKIVSSANGKKPTVGEQVMVHYAGFLEDGTLFDTSYEQVAKNYGQLDSNRASTGGYQPFPFAVGNKTGLIAGFIEAIENMKVGDKAVAIIPPHLGYGEQGAGDKIKPNATIIFEIELVKQ
jgi:peptidyl-prolyl cis-trans isomerase A (cyclophilin A)